MASMGFRGMRSAKFFMFAQLPRVFVLYVHMLPWQPVQGCLLHSWRHQCINGFALASPHVGVAGIGFP